jgi:hypothetical protein
MQINRQILVFDAPDLAAESGFWAGVLKGTVDADGDWAHGVGRRRPPDRVQLAPDQVAPRWPGGAQQQQIHFDLYVGDLAAAHDEVTALGATMLQAAEDTEAAEGFQVYADPSGHPFCLCWG